MKLNAPREMPDRGKSAPAAPALPEPLAEQKRNGHSLKEAELLGMGKEAIAAFGLADMAGMREAFPELHDALAEAGLGARLSFGAKRTAGSGEGKRPEDMDAEELRKLDPAHLDERAMYRLICAECFRMGSGSPYVGSRRGTVPKLQSNMNRKLGGPQHKLFKKCWERMVSEGAIAYNTNSSAASVEPLAAVRTPEIRDALGWAIRQQMKVSGEWRAKYEGKQGRG